MDREFGSAARPLFHRLLIGATTAALAAAVWGTHVYAEFPRVRQRIVRAEIAADDRSALTVPLPDLPALAGRPAALVADVRNSGSDPLPIVVEFDGLEVARATIPAGARRRIDASADVGAGQHAITVAGSRPGWTLGGLEVANVHGFSRAPFELVIVPRGARAPAPAIGAVAVLFLFVLVVAAWDLPRPRRGVWPLRVAGGLSIAILVTALVIDRVTPFAILLARPTFWLLLALLYLRKIAMAAAIVIRRTWPPLRSGAIAFWRHSPVRLARRHIWAVSRDLIPVLPHLVIVGALLYGVSGFWAPGVGFSRLILFGSQFADRSVPALHVLPHAVEENAGYDGQFYAQLAFDPLLRDPHTIDALDNAAYRARRVFFPLVAFVAGLGQPAWILQAYAVLNVVAWLVLAFALCAWLPPGQRGWARAFAAWTGCLLANGWIASIRLALTDGPSVLLMALSVLALERARLAVSSGVLAGAILGRETSALAVVALLPRTRNEISARRLIAIVGAVVPFALWMFYLRSLGLTDVVAERNLGAPFAGLWSKWAMTISELAEKGWWESWARVSLVCLVGMTVQAAYMLARWRWRSAWWRIGLAHAVLMIFLGPAVLDGYPGAVTRAMLPLAVAFNIELTKTGRGFWPLWIAGNLSILTSSELIHIPYFGSLI